MCVHVPTDLEKRAAIVFKYTSASTRIQDRSVSAHREHTSPLFIFLLYVKTHVRSSVEFPPEYEATQQEEEHTDRH